LSILSEKNINHGKREKKTRKEKEGSKREKGSEKK
jgi:hypothetical protein